MPTIEHADSLKDTIQLKGGQKLVIETKISGIPKPSASWTYNDQPLETGNNVYVETTGSTSKVTVNDITAATGGKYQIKAENVVGADTTDFTVVVKGK